MSLIRHCPRCHTDRPVDELVCNGRFQDAPCHWSLFDILPSPPGSATAPTTLPHVPPASVTACGPGLEGGQCRNGHPLGAGDFLCLVCGEPPAIAAADPGASPVEPGHSAAATRVVQGWRLGAPLAVVSGESDLFLAAHDGAPPDAPDSAAVFKHYRRGIEPEAALYPALRTLDPAHSLRLLDSGRFEERAFEVWEYLPLGTLGAIPPAEKANPDFVRQVVREIGGALHSLAEIQILHRDLKPANVLVRSRSPLDLVLADFSTATVSEFDLQLTMSRQTTRYAAPETIVGTCSAASDWWSLGVIVLEMLTQGHGFAGVHERAFLLNLVTRGLRVPDNLPEEWREILMGLLTRDPARRWAWPQVQRWLAGERGLPHGYHEEHAPEPQGRSLRLGTRAWSTPESFALAAADATAWDEALSVLQSGRLATWLQELGGPRNKARVTQLRTLTADLSLPENARLAAALLVLNEHLPLCLRGEMVTPAWILSHPDDALPWLTSSLPGHLRRLNRELWFVRLRERSDRVHARIRETGIECDQAQLSAALLATSEPMLEKRWRERRRLFPEATHPALAAILERRLPSEEDLILLVSAEVNLFRPAADVLNEAAREADRVNIPFNADGAATWFDFSRREILERLDERLARFVRCGLAEPDQWADDFRQNRHISLAHALVLLTVPPEQWEEPPQQDFIRNVITFFHRRLVGGMQRGGLLRMTIGRSTARLDLTELGGPVRSAEALLSAIITRQGHEVSLDPQPLIDDPQREHRLRRLHQNAVAYARDTSINALYLGFPFVVLRDARASEESKPRIAPVLLWPVTLNIPAGSRSNVRIAFDANRSEVRINPALEGLLGPAAAAWSEVLDDLRQPEHLTLSSVVDALLPLAPIAKASPAGIHKLTPLPPASVKVTPGQIFLHPSAVLFLSDFYGQTIAEDLKHLAMRPIDGTALEAAIRSGSVSPPDTTPPCPSELDRYFTAASDPSQQAAVFRSRQPPGMVVQGPPGTGKSQTIVNIVCDALGRGERVLIVCQKKAALQVVHKRLASEGLADRVFLLSDPVSDRKPTLLALRQQLEHPTRSGAEENQLRAERESLARQIESLEAELNSGYQAARAAPQNRPGHLTYRQLLEELLSLESGSRPPVSYAPLGTALAHLDYPTACRLIDQLSPLVPLWLKARFENSPLHCLADFRTDDATLADFRRAFDLFRGAEHRRLALLSQHKTYFEIDSPVPLQAWLTEHDAALRSLPGTVQESLARWSEFLAPSAGSDTSAAEQLIPWLEQIDAWLLPLDRWMLGTAIYEKIAAQGTTPLQELANHVRLVLHPATTIIGRLSLSRWLARRRISRWLQSAGADPQDTDLPSFLEAINLELRLREERPRFKQWRKALGESVPDSPESLPALRTIIQNLLARMRPVVAAANRIRECPVRPATEALLQCRDHSASASTLEACRASLSLWAAFRDSEASLAEAASWFNSDWIASRRLVFRQRSAGLDSLDHIVDALPTLADFQLFRLRAAALEPIALRLFALMRQREDLWANLPSASLPTEVNRTLRRELLLAWKAAAERDCPALLIGRAEQLIKIRLLEKRDHAMREANRRLLAKCSADVPMSSQATWDDVIKLQGPRARRLREVVDRGYRLGLFHLRPVWLMNPEMASRLFALKPALFDLVVFDEASQLPVECALPALYRARRAVVSGDEKQMPPTRFFGSQLDSDEEPDADGWLDSDDSGLDEQEQEARRLATERRELKDCPDLLTLAQNVLPTATLDVHYRSRYRELINFSNAAFYFGRLSVPALHPEAVIRSACPLQVDRVDGRYSDQTNETEADRVVAHLRQLWRRPPNERPTVGVVTFNLRQANLIEDKLEELAEVDDAFRSAWESEAVREQSGEDMGFFVKNLENVQGDERDWIIFSTTFGRDASNAFRRNFGVLGQHGGERRLNVAVTRAREKILLVTSMPTTEVSAWLNGHGRRLPSSPRDFVQAWLAYAERIHSGDFPGAISLLHSLNGHHPVRSHPRVGANNSPFKSEVATFLRSLGCEPIPADGDAFGVDFALVDPSTKLFGLGIECDAPDHAILCTARARELWRPKVLTASLPLIHRVALRDWYHDPTAERERLRAAVQKALGR